ncbi:MAG: ECF transporter S component [Candidatus Falkowbacteria bacterium]
MTYYINDDEREQLVEDQQQREDEQEPEEGLEQEQEIPRVDTWAAARFITLAGLATGLPFVIHYQLLSGPIVNAILIILLFVVGIRSALLVALIPSLMALAGGLLPLPLAPAVPFIMISNVLFVLVIDYCYKRMKDPQQGYWTGVIVGAGAKFIFLFISVNLIVRIAANQALAPKVAQMMSWPQFATALAGGVIAWAVLRWLKRI